MKNSYVTRHSELVETDTIVIDRKCRSADVLIHLNFIDHFIYLFIYFTSNLIFFTMDFTRKNCMVAYSKYVDKLINKIYITFKDSILITSLCNSLKCNISLNALQTQNIFNDINQRHTLKNLQPKDIESQIRTLFNILVLTFC